MLRERCNKDNNNQQFYNLNNMAYEKISYETQALFNKTITNSTLPSFVKIKILDNTKIKDNGKVTKAGEIIKFLNDFDIIIQVNEIIFSQLEEEQQQIIADELVAQIYFDQEKDLIKIIKFDVNTFSGIIQRHGIDKYMAVKESISTLVDMEKEKNKD